MQTLASTRGLTARTYFIDPGHSEVGFTVRHLGLAKVRGRFDRFDGTVRIAENPLESRVAVTIDLGSIDTNNADRDAHLRGRDFLDVDAHPAMTFVSTEVAEHELRGDLTINGVTKPVALDLQFNGVTDDPFGVTRAGFSATGGIHRRDFGIGFNAAPGVGMLVSDNVDIELEIELVPAS